MKFYLFTWSFEFGKKFNFDGNLEFWSQFGNFGGKFRRKCWVFPKINFLTSVSSFGHNLPIHFELFFSRKSGYDNENIRIAAEPISPEKAVIPGTSTWGTNNRWTGTTDGIETRDYIDAVFNREGTLKNLAHNFIQSRPINRYNINRYV